MPNTLTKIATQTITGTPNAITFGSIPQTYTDLLIKSSSKRHASGGTGAMYVYFNGSNASVRSYSFYGNGTASGSSTLTTAGNIGEAGEIAESGWASTDLYICNYASTSVFKSYLSESFRSNNGANTYQDFCSGLYSSATAITSVTLYTANTATYFIAPSVFTLYGIKNTP
jgi:hypothetical protein